MKVYENFLFVFTLLALTFSTTYGEDEPGDPFEPPLREEEGDIANRFSFPVESKLVRMTMIGVKEGGHPDSPVPIASIQLTGDFGDGNGSPKAILTFFPDDSPVIKNPRLVGRRLEIYYPLSHFADMQALIASSDRIWVNYYERSSDNTPIAYVTAYDP